MIVQHEKLVRDLIPGLLAARGIHSVTRTLDPGEYAEALIRKLQEEVSEFAERPCLEELADIVEVVHALAHHLGADEGELERLRKEKRLERGGFEKWICLIETR